jgi:NTP pyrophosphatase (non-canonical NTP hydrolase)
MITIEKLSAQMTLDRYAPLAMRTAKDRGSLYLNLWHGACGMLTELGEVADAYKKHEVYGKPLDKTNVLEELGDLMWYLALYANYGEYTLTAVPNMGPITEDSAFKLSAEHFLLLNFVPVIGVTYMAASESMLYGNKEVDLAFEKSEVQEAIGSAICTVEAFAKLLGSTLAEVLQMNINKLEKRYKSGGFTAEEAINRDVQAEKAVLDAANSGAH